jgi:hypothetical protein
MDKLLRRAIGSWIDEVKLLLMPGPESAPEIEPVLITSTIPASIDSFEYTGHVPYAGRDREETPITQVAISFYDYRRSISVEGQSPEQVGRLTGVLRELD